MPDPIQSQVLEVASDIFGAPVAALSPASSPETIENWDSVQHLNLILALESTFGIQIDPEDIDKMKTLGAVAQIVAKAKG